MFSTFFIINQLPKFDQIKNTFSECPSYSVSVAYKNQDWVAQTSIKFKCQLKLNWHLNLLEMYKKLIYT